MAVAILVAVAPLDAGGHTLVRWTARTSLSLFALAYAARPLVQLRPRPWSKRLLAYRKWLGLGFAVSHALHLAGILIIAAPDFGGFVRAQPPANAFAAVTFLLIFTMAFTSIEAVKRRMPASAWKRLHRTGMHFAWLSFAATYVGAIGASPLYAVPAAIVLGAGALRLAAFLRTTVLASRSRARPA